MVLGPRSSVTSELAMSELAMESLNFPWFGFCVAMANSDKASSDG